MRVRSPGRLYHLNVSVSVWKREVPFYVSVYPQCGKAPVDILNQMLWALMVWVFFSPRHVLEWHLPLGTLQSSARVFIVPEQSRTFSFLQLCMFAHACWPPVLFICCPLNFVWALLPRGPPVLIRKYLPSTHKYVHGPELWESEPWEAVYVRLARRGKPNASLS